MCLISIKKMNGILDSETTPHEPPQKCPKYLEIMFSWKAYIVEKIKQVKLNIKWCLCS